MGGIDGVSTRRPSSSEEYEKPLPDAAGKAADNRANAPWLVDGSRLAGQQTAYPAAIFENPAMYGPGVALAPPAPPAAARPEALAAAPNARHGITLANLADGLPTGTRTDAARAFTCGAGYKLYPEVARQPDGKDAIVYWTAFNAQAKRVEFVVGPDALKTFTSAPSDFAIAAANGFMGEQDAATRESAKVVDIGMRDGFGAALRQLGHAWRVAGSDPKWVAKTALNVASSFAPGGPARGASSEVRAAVSEADEAARIAGGSIRKVNKDLPLGNTIGVRDRNCANCAIATDATLAGNPASALPGKVTKGTVLEKYYGTKWSSVIKDAPTIEATMQAAGPGSRAIVYGEVPGSSVGHYFNVVNQNGTIRFLDGQAGGVANVAPYSSFNLLRTK